MASNNIKIKNVGSRLALTAKKWIQRLTLLLLILFAFGGAGQSEGKKVYVAKIEDNTRKPQYILTVHGIGYKFGGE